MAGSVAEERIRSKAEALLRQYWPTGRVIHELVLQQGGVRIDLACVTEDMVVALEIKSERDVLTRLPQQAAVAVRTCDAFGVCVAAEHADMILPGYAAYAATDGQIGLPYPAELLVERDDGFGASMSAFCHRYLGDRHATRLINPADRLEMLWADELRAISGTRLARQKAKALICETMTGRDIRRAVCRTLRARAFPRADPAIGLDIPGLAA